MWNDMQAHTGKNPNVTKFVFTKDDAVAEAVLYKYGTHEERTVICCSTQSGCPVGCTFCGTGKHFIRNLTASEITAQIQMVLKTIECRHSSMKRFQIMFMSMGEPFLNMANLVDAIYDLNDNYRNAELLVSTSGAKAPTWAKDIEKFTRCSKAIDKVGLQLSIHKMIDSDRNKLIPFPNKLSIRELRDVGIFWHKQTERPVFLNFCVEDAWGDYERIRLLDMFSPIVFNLTFSVICNSQKGELSSRGYELAKKMDREHMEMGYNTRTFNPDGQDDIGAGCGQLWFVQDWLKGHKKAQEI